MVLLGEVGKMVPVSAMRFASIDGHASDSTKVEMTGAVGETVEIVFMTKGATSAKKTSCKVGPDGNCSLLLK
eukprot:SAG31_NODE_313_length_17858_cov_34.811307_7_plen_72_part_00